MIFDRRTAAGQKSIGAQRKAWLLHASFDFPSSPPFDFGGESRATDNLSSDDPLSRLFFITEEKFG